MTFSERVKGVLFSFFFFAIGVGLFWMVIRHPSWIQAPHWIVYLSGIVAHMFGLLCVAISLNWRKLRNILLIVLTSLFGLIFTGFAIGPGPRECWINSTVLETGLSCRFSAGLGALLWFTGLWGVLAGNIQE